MLYVAGTSYTGALVVSNDGHWPEMTPNTVKRINDALAKGGIMNWELFEVRKMLRTYLMIPFPMMHGITGLILVNLSSVGLLVLNG